MLVFGHHSCAVLRACPSSGAQQTVSCPYFGFPLPPESSNVLTISAFGATPMKPSPPASTAVGSRSLDPSPNIRDEETALLYPGTVFYEATNLSEGRGTAAPLKQVGASWLADATEIATTMNGLGLPGVRFSATTAAVGMASAGS